MRLKELLEEVSALGFESEPELTDSFIFSANRALRYIFNELVGDHSKMLYFEKPESSLYLNSLLREEGSEIIFVAVGNAMSFKHLGSGVIEFNGRNTKKTLSFSGTGSVRTFIENGTKVKFVGDAEYKINDLNVWKGLYESDEKAIPLHNEKTAISLSEKIEGFMTVTRAPEDKNGVPIDGVTVRNDILFLPYGFSGEVNISYKRLPTTLTVDDIDSPVDIPAKYEHLLAMLTAAFVWLDEDPEKSDYYMRLYREEAASVRTRISSRIGEAFYEVTGWSV